MADKYYMLKRLILLVRSNICGAQGDSPIPRVGSVFIRIRESQVRASAVRVESLPFVVCPIVQEFSDVDARIVRC